MLQSIQMKSKMVQWENQTKHQIVDLQQEGPGMASWGFLCVVWHDVDMLNRLTGGYKHPISVNVTANDFRVIRPGCFGFSLLIQSSINPAKDKQR